MIRGPVVGCPPDRHGGRQGEPTHFEGSCLEQGVGRRVEGAAGRQHVVYEPDACPGVEPARDAEGPPHVCSSFRTRQRSLGPGLPNAFEPVRRPRPIDQPRNPSRDRVGVIESTSPPTSRVERHAHDEVRSSPGFGDRSVGELEGQKVDREADRNGWTEWAPSRLEAGNPAADGSFVADERMAHVKRASVGEAARTGVVGGRRAKPGPSRDTFAERATARTAVRRAPARESPVTGATERTVTRRQMRITLDAAARGHGLEERPGQGLQSIHRSRACPAKRHVPESGPGVGAVGMSAGRDPKRSRG